MEKKKINTYPRQDQVIDDMKAMHIARSYGYGDEGVRIISHSTSKHVDCLIFLRPNVPT